MAKDGELPLFAGDLDGEAIAEPQVSLPDMSLGEEVVEDYVAMRLTLRAHPLALLRHRLTPQENMPPPSPGKPVTTAMSNSAATGRHPRAVRHFH